MTSADDRGGDFPTGSSKSWSSHAGHAHAPRGPAQSDSGRAAPASRSIQQELADVTLRMEDIIMRTRNIAAWAALPAMLALGAALSVRGRQADRVEPKERPAVKNQEEGPPRPKKEADPLPFPPLPSRIMPGPAVEERDV